jgi:hypothetical protein
MVMTWLQRNHEESAADADDIAPVAAAAPCESCTRKRRGKKCGGKGAARDCLAKPKPLEEHVVV